MLVLSRKLGESIVINGDIRVTVVAIKGGKVRLGFTAPSTARVVRQEIYEDHSHLSADAVVPATTPPEPAASTR